MTAARTRISTWLRRQQESLLPEGVVQHLLFAQASGFTPRTVEARKSVLRRLFVEHACCLDMLTTEQVVGWLSREDWTSQSRETYFGHVSAYYRWAHDMERIPKNPMAKMKRPRVPRGKPRPLSGEEFAAVMAVDLEPWRTAILLAYYAGLRAGEISRLRREDVTSESIRVLGKGGRTDVIPMHPTLWAHIGHRSPGPLVTRPDGSEFAERQLSTRFSNWITYQMGMPKTGLHRLRHSYATKLLRSGVNIRVVQELMRHENLATTARYTAVDEDERTAAVRCL